MGIIIEIGRCQHCGKQLRKEKLIQVKEFWCTKQLCKSCYQRYQRSTWGYW